LLTGAIDFITGTITGTIGILTQTLSFITNSMTLTATDTNTITPAPTPTNVQDASSSLSPGEALAPENNGENHLGAIILTAVTVICIICVAMFCACRRNRHNNDPSPTVRNNDRPTAPNNDRPTAPNNDRPTAPNNDRPTVRNNDRPTVRNNDPSPTVSIDHPRAPQPNGCSGWLRNAYPMSGCTPQDRRNTIAGVLKRDKHPLAVDEQNTDGMSMAQ